MSNLDRLLLHPRTKAQLQGFIKRPSHTLLITGDVGTGKLATAQQIAAKLLQLQYVGQLQKYPYFTHVKRPQGKQDIPIDFVRQLTKMLKLKVPGSGAIKRVIIIEDAQDLNEEAANAMLKMLEEPAPDCVFILSATSANSLLPTIVSRAQQLQVHPVNLNDSLAFHGGVYTHEQITNAWQLSQGNAGLMLALLKDDIEHPLKIAISVAKDYLRKNPYERLLLAGSISKDKKQLALFLEALLKLLIALHHRVVEQGNKAQQSKILASRKLIYKLQGTLDANSSPKLVALELSLNLL